jgi:phosphoglycolate phosphatase
MDSTNRRKIELVLFDFDGTLVDTAPDIIRAANRFLKERGKAELTELQIRSHIGMGLKQLMMGLFPELNRESQIEEIKAEYEDGFMKIYQEECLKSPMAFEGIHEFIEDFDGRIAIVSNKRERFIRPILEKVGLAHYPWLQIVGGDTYPNMKPHPQPFLEVIGAADTTPQNTVIVGDGIPDVRGALAIGSRCIAVEFGYTPADELLKLGAWRRLEAYWRLKPMLDSVTYSVIAPDEP